LWNDTFTDSDGTNLSSHTPDTGSGGYSNIAGNFEVISNKIQVVGTTTSGAIYSFDPGVVNTTAKIDFNFVNTGDSDLRFVYFGFRFTISVVDIMAGIGRIGGNWTLIVQDPSTGLYSANYSIPITANTWYTLSATNDGSHVTATIGSHSVSLTTSTNSTETAMLLQAQSGSYGTGGVLLNNLCVN
jgi:hypothetical protein